VWVKVGKSVMVGVIVGVRLGVTVFVHVAVGEAVLVEVGVGVIVWVGVRVGVCVGVAVCVGLPVSWPGNKNKVGEGVAEVVGVAPVGVRVIIGGRVLTAGSPEAAPGRNTTRPIPTQ
jgi:hypothetical protein